MSNFNYLFTPLKVGNLELKNRIIVAPHTTNYQRGDAQDCAYLEARARGGASAVVLATALTLPIEVSVAGINLIGIEKGIEQHTRAIEAVHRGGAKAFVELYAGLAYQSGASGAVPNALLANQPRTMLVPEIQFYVAMVAEGANNAKTAGADGVELIVSFGADFQSFTSSLFNKREDEYGGSVENRARIVLEALAAIKARCGNDFVVGAVVDVDESALGGNTLEEGVQMCKLFADSGNIDYIRVTANNIKAQQGHLHYPSSYMPQGVALYAAAAVREVVDSIPIMGSHRINSAEFAEQALAEGQCDLIAMCRALIADPELPNKARQGKSDEIRSCIGCVEACYQRHVLGVPIGCSVNPDAGFEFMPEPAPLAGQKVLVVGGGIAGMEAALVAAQRGGQVTLVEKAEELGGTVRMQAKLPGLTDRGDIIGWFERQLAKEKVEVCLATEATPEFVIGFGADKVLVATGSTYDRLGITQDTMQPIPGLNSIPVYTPEDIVLDGKAVAGDHVVVYDSTGYEVGPGIAEMLASQGKTVDFVTQQPIVGATVQTNYLSTVLSMRLLSACTVIRDHQVAGINGNTVELTNIYTYEGSAIENVDGIVLVTSKPPAEQLYFQLLGQIPHVELIGDANTAIYTNFGIYSAILSGKEAACTKL